MQFHRIAFAFTLLTVGLHLLRNISLPLYGALYLAALTLSLLGLAQARSRIEASWPISLWASAAVYGALITLIFSGPLVAAYGFVRFLFAAPILIALAYCTRSKADLIGHVKLMCVFVAACAATIPLQIVTGPIAWFADDSVRGTFERYSSLAGSLTSFGIIVGCFIAVTMSIRVRYDWLLVSIMLIGAISSLSKAAIANAVAGLVIGIWINRSKLGRIAASALPLTALLLSSLIVFPGVLQRLQSVLISFGVEPSANVGPNYDSSVGDSVIDRLTVLPMENFRALADLETPLAYLAGGGFGMASTALVPRGRSLAPMAHNQFAEIMTVFGLLGGVALISAMAYIGISLFRRARYSTLAEGTAWAYALFLVNSLFANGTVYQPISATFFFLAMFVALCNINLLIKPGSTPLAEGAKQLTRVRR